MATDIRQPTTTDTDFRLLDVMDREALRALVIETKTTAIYHLAAFLSASGEQRPLQAWDLNMQGLLNVLEVARETGCQVFWPSSIAVFRAHAHKPTGPHNTVTNPPPVHALKQVAATNCSKQ